MSLNPDFNPYAAGKKLYGTGKHNPTEGAVDKTGYVARDRRRKVKLNALRAKIGASTKGAFASSDYLR